MSRLVCRDAVAKNFMVTNFVLSLAAGVAYITVNGIYIAILNLLNDTDMIQKNILGSGFISG